MTDETIAQRERWRERKRRQRADKAAEHQAEAEARADGYRLPPMPAGPRAQRKWGRLAQDAFEAGKINAARLMEARRSMASQSESYRTGAEIRKSKAAMRSAEATERMADALAAVEHGGAAVLLLKRLQEGLTEGKRRPLPGARVLPMAPTPDGAA